VGAKGSSRVLVALCLVGVVAGAAGAGAVLLREPGPEVAGADESIGEPSTTTTPPTSTPTTAASITTTSAPTTTTTPPTTAPPTTAPPTTAPPAPPSLRAGAEGPEVQALQTTLESLGYWLGGPDGHYAHLTQQAVLAFQKANGLSRDGIAGPQTLAALAAATRPAARALTDGIEIDLERQVLLVVQGGQVTHVLNTSTGRSGWRTPAGDFAIDRQVDGWRHAPLGDLYRPKYFNDGIAVHGSNSIPGQPASHGCARVSITAMDMLWSSGLAEVGTRVVVY
jgi:peptidoglycan hydrolase-like protein with peptidoglycan-binding domain